MAKLISASFLSSLLLLLLLASFILLLSYINLLFPFYYFLIDPHFQCFNGVFQSSLMLLSMLSALHCGKTVRIWSYSCPRFSRIFSLSDWIQKYTQYHFVFSPNAGKCGKKCGPEYLRIRTLFTQCCQFQRKFIVTYLLIIFLLIFSLIKFRIVWISHIKEYWGCGGMALETSCISSETFGWTPTFISPTKSS